MMQSNQSHAMQLDELHAAQSTNKDMGPPVSLFASSGTMYPRLRLTSSSRSMNVLLNLATLVGKISTPLDVREGGLSLQEGLALAHEHTGFITLHVASGTHLLSSAVVFDSETRASEIHLMGEEGAVLSPAA